MRTGRAYYNIGDSTVKMCRGPIEGRARDGALLDIKVNLDSHDCKPARAYTNTGVYVSTRYVTGWMSCHHSLYAAAITRMAGTPKGMIGRVEKDIAEYANQFDLSFLMRKVPIVDVMTPEDWVRSKFNVKDGKAMLDRYYQRIHQQDRKLDMFIKFEPSILHGDQDIVFDNHEVIMTTEKLDPRGISVPKSEERVENGPLGRALGEIMRDMHDGSKGVLVANGRDQEEMSEKIMSAIESKGELICTQGDDVLAIRNGIVLEADASRHDMHMSMPHFAICWKITDHYVAFIRGNFHHIIEKLKKYDSAALPS